MQAVWNGHIIAEANKEELVYIEGNWYFPPHAVDSAYLQESDTPYTCPWKGDCQYFSVGQGEQWSKDSAWCYPQPKDSAIATVKHDFSGYVAFWRDVAVVEGDPTKPQMALA